MGAQDSPADLVAALRALFGQHRARPAHAKGVLLEGAFKCTREAHQLCASPLFDGAIDHVTVRFSSSTGLPGIPDTAPEASPRGLAVRFRLRDGAHADVVAHSFDGFPVGTAAEFGTFLHAVAASGPEAAKPTALDRFLAEHPAAVRFLTTQQGPPVSWATLAYYGVNAFRFVDAQGRGTHVRYRLVPQAGVQLLDAAAVASKGPDYLAEEITARVGREPILFDWFAQIAERGDVVDDPSTPWPPTRRLVRLGTIEIVRMAFDQALDERVIGFLPGNVPPCIEPADPMIAVRDAAYRLSYADRQ